MTQDEVAALYATQTKPTPKTKWYDSEGTPQSTNPTSNVKGYFTGKQGTHKRSRKGRTTIMPNGTRTITNTFNFPETPLALAYIATAVV